MIQRIVYGMINNEHTHATTLSELRHSKQMKRKQNKNLNHIEYAFSTYIATIIVGTIYIIRISHQGSKIAFQQWRGKDCNGSPPFHPLHLLCPLPIQKCLLLPIRFKIGIEWVLLLISINRFSIYCNCKRLSSIRLIWGTVFMVLRW